ncbi:MAG TPA: YbaB/EbfC family nucleoid-associated protein [Pirellulales bacterium]|nr:YbaB/EbfC family nucleoid-associated protein [Pirellulales bacterium]
MLGALGNLGSLFKQAKQLEGKLAGMTDDLRSRRATGAAGGGLVEVEVNGLEEVLQCRIDPGLFAQGDRELMEDLVCAAVNLALEKAKQLHAEAMRSVAGGISLPGLDEALAKLTGGGSSPGGPAAVE